MLKVSRILSHDMFEPAYMLSFLQEWYGEKDTKFSSLFSTLKLYQQKFPFQGQAFREPGSDGKFGWGTSWSKSYQALDDHYARPNSQIYTGLIQSGVDLGAMAAFVHQWQEKKGQPRDTDVEQIMNVQEVVPLSDPTEIQVAGKTAL